MTEFVESKILALFCLDFFLGVLEAVFRTNIIPKTYIVSGSIQFFNNIFWNIFKNQFQLSPVFVSFFILLKIKK